MVARATMMSLRLPGRHCLTATMLHTGIGLASMI